MHGVTFNRAVDIRIQGIETFVRSRNVPTRYRAHHALAFGKASRAARRAFIESRA